MASARLEWTSVPRWTSPALPPAASYLACWFGAAAERRVSALLAGVGPGLPVRRAGFPPWWDDSAEAELRRLIRDCRIGVRIILAGPEALVMRSVAVARELGATDEELVPIAAEAVAALEAAEAAEAAEATEATAYVSGVAPRRVFCAPCRRTFDAVAAIGGTATCPGCATELLVDHRFSRPRAAYFGWPVHLDLHR